MGAASGRISTNCIKNPGLKDFRASPKNLKLFSQLVKEKKIPRGADVRQLPNIVNDKKAFQKLQATGFKPALRQAGRTQPSQVYALFRQIQKTRLALEKIKQAELEDIQRQAASKKNCVNCTCSHESRKIGEDRTQIGGGAEWQEVTWLQGSRKGGSGRNHAGWTQGGCA